MTTPAEEQESVVEVNLLAMSDEEAMNYEFPEETDVAAEVIEDTPTDTTGEVSLDDSENTDEEEEAATKDDEQETDGEGEAADE